DRGVIRLIVDDEEVVWPPSALDRRVDNLAQCSRHSLQVGNLLHRNNDDRALLVEGSADLVRIEDVERGPRGAVGDASPVHSPKHDPAPMLSIERVQLTEQSLPGLQPESSSGSAE